MTVYNMSPLPSTSKKSSLPITINKQTLISPHYQSINLTITINKQTVISHMIMVRDDCLFVDGNGER
jgi:hypothetical protein